MSDGSSYPRRISVNWKHSPSINVGSLSESSIQGHSDDTRLRTQTAVLSSRALQEGFNSYRSEEGGFLNREFSSSGQAVADEMPEGSLPNDNTVPPSAELDAVWGTSGPNASGKDASLGPTETVTDQPASLVKDSYTMEEDSSKTALLGERSGVENSRVNSTNANSDPSSYQTFARLDSVVSANNQSTTSSPAATLKHFLISKKHGIFRPHNISKYGLLTLNYMPSVLLGALLNVLDGLSYGMILFPLGSPVFAKLGPAGLSMFYMSCIVSQLVYSCGGSIFKAGIGSEMIEVVPFFHTMAFSLLNELGDSDPDAVIATTITAYAMSSIVTGGVFFILGYMRLGSLISFFPRHILIGCIGGVGWFLVATGVQVTAGLSSLEYNMVTLEYLYSTPKIVLQWNIPLGLAIILLLIQKFITHHPLTVPLYIMAIFAVVHIILFALPNYSLAQARHDGWVFDPPEQSEAWYEFYSLYKFNKVDFVALLKTIPAMFALTFFGILHVPINVPALANSIGEDDVDVDRELVAHGISNALSGCLGSIQNYLVYTNSVLFIRSGADSRYAGVLLAVATAIIMILGSSTIGLIPVTVVGTLIYILGFELMEEALVDTWSRLTRIEYYTVVIIVVTMGVWDFVYGIVAGIILACFFFVVQASQVQTITAEYTGQVARSTVRRHATLQNFLKQVGNQIHVIKLTGYLFFGTFTTVETAVIDLLDRKHFTLSPFRYLILDLKEVTDIDFSAAEAFARIQRRLATVNVYLILSSCEETDHKMKSVISNGLLENDAVNTFKTLNSALEWCENEFITHYYRHVEEDQSYRPIPRRVHSHKGTMHAAMDPTGSPRGAVLRRAFETSASHDLHNAMRWRFYKQPVPLLMEALQQVSSKNEEFWVRVAPFFKTVTFRAGEVLYNAGSPAKGFYVVESGILRADYERGLYETILAGTTCGELPFFSGTDRTATVSAEVDSVVWKLDEESWKSMQGESELVNELLEVALKLTVERFTSITSYVQISAN